MMRSSAISAISDAQLLDAHMGAIALPEAAHRGFGRAGAFGRGAGATHLDHRTLAGGRRHAALHEAADRAVFHRDVARRPRQVALLESYRLHLGRVVGKA